MSTLPLCALPCWFMTLHWTHLPLTQLPDNSLVPSPSVSKKRKRSYSTGTVLLPIPYPHTIHPHPHPHITLTLYTPPTYTLTSTLSHPASSHYAHLPPTPSHNTHLPPTPHIRSGPYAGGWGPVRSVPRGPAGGASGCEERTEGVDPREERAAGQSEEDGGGDGTEGQAN